MVSNGPTSLRLSINAKEPDYLVTPDKEISPWICFSEIPHQQLKSSFIISLKLTTTCFQGGVGIY